MPSLWRQRWRSFGELSSSSSQSKLSSLGSPQTVSSDPWLSMSPMSSPVSQSPPLSPLSPVPESPLSPVLESPVPQTWLSQQSLVSSLSSSQLSDCSCCQGGTLKRSDSAMFLEPFLPYVEIAPEKGLRKYRSWVRLMVRRARKNILRRPTHQHTVPADLKQQLKGIYVY